MLGGFVNEIISWDLSWDFYVNAWGKVSDVVIDGLATIGELAASALDGARVILNHIVGFVPSFSAFTDLLPPVPAAVAVSILSVMATVITFKVVGYFT